MTKKYVFLDIDRDSCRLLRKNAGEREEGALRGEGERAQVILCTGRFYSQIYGWLLDMIPFDGFVTSSGAHVRLDGRTVFTHYFPGDMIRELRRVCGPLGAALMFPHRRHLVTTREELDAARDFFGRTAPGRTPATRCSVRSSSRGRRRWTVSRRRSITERSRSRR